MEIRKTRQFCSWITYTERLVFQEVRLEMNSLRVKKDDIIRRLINEPASMASAPLLFASRSLRAETQEWS